MTQISIAEKQGARPRRVRWVGKAAFIAAKLAITGGCFWYLSRKIDFTGLGHAITTIDLGWAMLGAAAIAMQFPLVGIRWSKIIDALTEGAPPIPRVPVIAVTAIGIFFGQVLPYAAGDAMRVWMLTRLGYGWRTGVISVVIDRAVGIAVLMTLGCIILLLPSALAALGGERDLVLATFGSLVAVGMASLLCAPLVYPVLMKWSYLRWIGTLAFASHKVLIRSRSGPSIAILAAIVHTLTIGCAWCIGQSLEMPFSLIDASVLFILMLGVSLVPVSFGGWGVREIAVVSLLTSHGIGEDRALLYSVIFGLALVVGSLPGAFVWACYSPVRLRQCDAEREYAG